MTLESGKEYVITDKTGEVIDEGQLTASSPDTISIEGTTYDKDSVIITEK